MTSDARCPECGGETYAADPLDVCPWCDPEPCARCGHTAGSHGNGGGPIGLACEECACPCWVGEVEHERERARAPRLTYGDATSPRGGPLLTRTPADAVSHDSRQMRATTRILGADVMYRQLNDRQWDRAIHELRMRGGPDATAAANSMEAANAPVTTPSTEDHE